MRVIATRNGYYGCFREPGQAFDLADRKHFSKAWMNPAPKGTPLPPKEPQAPGQAVQPANGTKQPEAPQQGGKQEAGKDADAI